MHLFHDLLQFIAVHFHHFVAGVQHHLHAMDGSGGGPGKATAIATPPPTGDGSGGGPG